MPMTSPRESTSGPPELPGLRAASVWMTLSISAAAGARSAAAQGADDAGGDGELEAERLPMAMASWPTLRVWSGRGRPGTRRRRRCGGRRFGVGIFADEGGGGVRPSPRATADCAGVVDDVAVGEDEAVGGEDEAGAGAAGALVVPGPDFSTSILTTARADALDGAGDGAGIGVEEGVVA